MVLRRKVVGSYLKRIGAVVASVAAFGLGYALKAVQVPVSCSVDGTSIPLAMATTCGGQSVTTFTNAAVNTTISAFECLPRVFVDSDQALSCVVPIGGSFVAAVGAGVVGLVIARKLSYFRGIKTFVGSEPAAVEMKETI